MNNKGHPNKLELKARRKPNSKRGNRFLTSLDMAIIKHDASVRNADVKRGVRPENVRFDYISICGCGVEGCAIHGSAEKYD